MRYHILFLLLFSSLWAAEARFAANHLEGETSPYLKQHLHNPVDWYPWGDEAFEKARREHKPIFLSIGYSTCHWCHVMARESFENPDIAELINTWFVPVKVDREEMPHLDKHFQRVYALLHGRSGGWPLTVFLTEEGEPFFAATYLPPEDGYGVRGLATLVPYYGRLYRTDKQALLKRAAAIEKLLEKSRELPRVAMPKELALADRAVELMWKDFDKLYKGWGDRPKFPESARIGLLLDIWEATRNEKAKKMALETLAAMADSGLYDQVDGAFFRYCVDRAWRMPHFEKMLYTNAELVPLYVRAWRMNRNHRFKEVARETIGEISRRFETKEGLYFSASNAESGGMEGGYFLFRYEEAGEALRKTGLSEAAVRANLAYLDIGPEGNFDTEYAHARRAGYKPPEEFERARAALKRLRKGRDYPFVDRKIITAWNAMWIEALFEAAPLYGGYLSKAQRSYRALKEAMGTRNCWLFHQTLYGQKPTQPGLLEDYAFFAAAALAGYEATLDEGYLKDAKRWAKRALEAFYEGKGRWLLGREGGVAAYADMDDGYYTSPMSKMAGVLQRLALLEGDPEMAAIVRETLEANALLLQKRPDAYPKMLDVWLREAFGMVVVEAKRSLLLKHRHDLAEIAHPFLYLKADEEIEGFAACGLRGCFASAETVEALKGSIEKR